MKKIELNITGMHCASCKKLIEMELLDKTKRINWIRADNEKSIVEIEFDENNISERGIEEAVKKLGYRIKR